MDTSPINGNIRPEYPANTILLGNGPLFPRAYKSLSKLKITVGSIPIVAPSRNPAIKYSKQNSSEQTINYHIKKSIINYIPGNTDNIEFVILNIPFSIFNNSEQLNKNPLNNGARSKHFLRL